MALPTIRLCEIHFYRFDMRTRFPFRYGIASMTDIPHLLVEARVEVDGHLVRGFSAEGLPPKWFTKNPATTFQEDDLPAMLRVIRHATDVAAEIGRQPSFFSWWRGLYEAQQAWAADQQIAPLLAGLGTSLLERTVLDAFCRQGRLPLFEALRQNVLGIELGSLRPPLGILRPVDVLADSPLPAVQLRHTIGLGDPLADEADVHFDRPQDGLPFTLEENIRRYGLRYFKIKLSGKLSDDRERLSKIAKILEQTVEGTAQITLDGNENFSSLGQFRSAWNHFQEVDQVRRFFQQSLLFVEQPVHRNRALEGSVGEELRDWQDAPPIIIDESDADLTSLPTALSLGYRGTSHKNCKGIIKGLLAAATIQQSSEASKPLVLSAEDLGNVGPLALLQDLAMVAALGIEHVERNGHHYFAGMGMFPKAIQQDLLTHHGDLYETVHGFVALAPRGGRLLLDSVNAAPFGLGSEMDMQAFDRWSL